MKEKNYSISLLKILSCFAVLALHTQRNYNLMIVHNPILYYFSRYAIPIFFMVNGFLILSKERANDYYIKKIKSIIIFIIIWSLILGILKKSNPFDILLKSMLSEGTLSIFWFFWALIIIYTFNMIIRKIIHNKNNKKNILLIFFVFFIICLVVDIFQFIYFRKTGIFFKICIPQTFRIWTWIMYFYLGGIINKIIRACKNIKFLLIFLIFIVLSILSVILQYYLFCVLSNKINSEYIYDNIIIILWSISLFLLINRIKINRNALKKVITFVEDKTTGVYPIHILFIKVFNLTYHTNGWLYSTIIWVMLILFSIISTYILSLNKITKKLVTIK